MSYATNQTIEAQHYNLLVWGDESGGSLVTSNNNLNYLWGPGYGDKGMNQNMSDILGLPNNQGVSPGVYNDTIGTLSPVDGVSAGDATNNMTITAQQWIGLVSAINRAAYHQNSGNLTLSVAPGFGRSITVFSGLSTKLSTISTNMGSARSTVTRNIPNSATSYAWIESSSAAIKTASRTRAVTWQSGDDARWFFNAGGYIIVGLSATGATNGRSSAIATVLNDLGTAEIRNTYTVGFPNNDDTNSVTTKGYWDLGTNWVQIGKNTAAAGSTYSSTSVTVYARVNETASGVGTENGAAGNRLEIRVDLYSDYGTDPLDWGADNINLTATVTLDVKDPAVNGGMLTRTWADPEFS